MTRKMKDSGIQWIKEIPVDWQVSKISALFELRNEKVNDRDYPALSVTNKGIVPQLETAAKTNAHDDRKLVRKGDFAINSRSDRRGSCGISFLDGSVSLINIVLAPRNEMNARYYDWLFHTIQFGDEFYKRGHGIVDDLWTTGWQDMKKITIPTPALYEQQKIADFLDEKCVEIDALSSDIQSQINILEKYKKSVITEAVTKGLNPDVEMKDSGIEWIGKIPYDWNITKVKFLCEMQSGDNITAQDINEEKDEIDCYKVYGANGFRGYYKKYTHKGKYCLVGRQGALSGNVHIVDDIFWATDHAIVVCVNEKVLQEYMYYLLIAMNLNQYAFNTAAQPGLAVSQIMNLQIVCPLYIQQQKLIVDFLEKRCAEIDNTIDGKKQQLKILEQYKKSLIYEYVTGKKEIFTND